MYKLHAYNGTLIGSVNNLSEARRRAWEWHVTKGHSVTISSHDGQIELANKTFSDGYLDTAMVLAYRPTNRSHVGYCTRTGCPVVLIDKHTLHIQINVEALTPFEKFSVYKFIQEYRNGKH